MRMWLLLLSHFLILPYLHPLYAQTPVPVPVAKKVKSKVWQMGIEGGLDLSRFSASRELFSPESHTGWFVGPKIKVNIPLPNLGLDAAFLYNQSGLEYKEQNTNDYKSKRMHMFVVPLNLRYSWSVASSFQFILFSGPQWNWLLDHKKIDNIGKFEHSFFDWNIGMGFELLKHVQFAFNYNIPLGKMGEVNNVNLEGHTWNIRLAYFF